MDDQLIGVEDSDELYRRVFPYQISGDRVSSSAFKDKRKRPLHKFSADLARLTTPEEFLKRSSVSGLRVISFFARTPRTLGFRVWHDPENEDFAHCSVEGESSKEKCDLLALESWPTALSA